MLTRVGEIVDNRSDRKSSQRARPENYAITNAQRPFHIWLLQNEFSFILVQHFR